MRMRRQTGGGNRARSGAQMPSLLAGPAIAPRSSVAFFGTAEVARILRTTPARVRAIVRAGLCRPAQHGRTFAFAFQDLVVLRVAQGLLAAAVPPRRIRCALRELARQLPAGRPLSAVRVYADGQRVVARDGHAAWHPDSGQIVFSFEVAELARRAGAVIPVWPGRRPAPGKAELGTPSAWFERGLAYEQKGNLAAACDAYQRALALDARFADAYINLGRLLHQGGNAPEAVRLYHLALESAPEDAIAHYNLAIALEDRGQLSAALAHYQRALASDPHFADAHFNAARLLERLGRQLEALRHLASYKKLTHT